MAAISSLREVGGPGQKKLRAARVLVVGAGGLGAPVLQYLAAAGVGTIGVIDDDVVDNTNLQRQVIHRDQDIGSPKVFSAQAAMLAQNPFVTVRPYHRRFEAEIAKDLLSDYDLVIDGCDNFETRYLVNATAVALKKPLISGALSQWEGQLSVFDPAQWRALLSVHIRSGPGRRAGTVLCGGGGDRAAAGGGRVDDGDRGNQADHRGRNTAARADADL